MNKIKMINKFIENFQKYSKTEKGQEIQLVINNDYKDNAHTKVFSKDNSNKRTEKINQRLKIKYVYFNDQIFLRKTEKLLKVKTHLKMILFG